MSDESIFFSEMPVQMGLFNVPPGKKFSIRYAQCAAEKSSPFLPAAKPSGPRTVRVVVVVGGGDQFAKVNFVAILLPTHNFLRGGIQFQ